MSIKHERKLSIETINIATNTEQQVKGKTDHNSIVITKPQRFVLDPQEKTTRNIKEEKKNVRNPNTPHWRNRSPTPNIKHEQMKRMKGKNK